MNERKYVYVNHNNRCVLVGTAQYIADQLEGWDENTPPDDQNDYFFAEVDHPEIPLVFWDVFGCKVFVLE